MDVYRKLNLKYSNRCKKCGTRLEVGTAAYGRKHFAGKWEFLCNDCISELPEAAEMTPTTIEPEKLTEVLKHAKAILPTEAEALLESLGVEKESAWVVSDDGDEVVTKGVLGGIISDPEVLKPRSMNLKEVTKPVDDDVVVEEEPEPTTLEGIMGGARWKL
jgi:hypothetical protein